MSRHKIKITHLVPKMPLAGVYLEKCYLGISINNPFFLGQNLETLLAWTNKRFPHCKIIVGDHLQRINEYIVNGVTDEAAAIQAAKNNARVIVEKFADELKKFPAEKFEFEFWEKYYTLKACQDNKDNLQKLFREHDGFRRAVQHSANDFITRQISRGVNLKADISTAEAKSVEYILEEMAVFNYLIDNGYRVQIYPGTQLTILKELALGQFPDIKLPLNRGIYIDLTVKRVS